MYNKYQDMNMMCCSRFRILITVNDCYSNNYKIRSFHKIYYNIYTMK